MQADNTPIIIGVGQSVSHWQAADGLAKAPSPVGMAAIAAKRAIRDTSANLKIDTLVLVRTMADSIPATQYHLGSPVNAPGALAHRLGIKPDRLIYGSVGGDTPQALVSEMAERIYEGNAQIALIAGGEATGAAKIISHTISYYKGQAISGFALCETEKGRCLAKISPDNLQQFQLIANSKDPQTVLISTKNNVNNLHLSS